MRYSKLLGRTNREAPADADSANARLLVQAGYVDQLMAGVYTYLPLGLRVLDKIKDIIRDEMNALGAQEVLMPALHPKSLYDTTNRWDTIDVLFKMEGHGGKDYALGSTHEEVVTPLVKAHVKSYKDLPLAVYQIQDKFRNEARAKSGLLRGREFAMKDMYSFHTAQEDFEAFYEKSKEAYLNVYRRCGIDAVIAKADGGTFTDRFSHEFQVATESGEDLVYTDKATGESMNKEVVPEEDWENTDKYDIVKSIEVGNIFPLECKFSGAFDFKIQGSDGQPINIIMGCYGIGASRLLGSVVEVHHDDNGIIWPESIAPYKVVVVPVNVKDDTQRELAENLYKQLGEAGVEVMIDDRDERPGAKFADADLIGLPWRVTVGRGAADGIVELQNRASGEMEELKADEVVERLR